MLAVALLLTLLGTGAAKNGASKQPADDRPSILVIVVDTLQARAVSAYGSVEGTTPALDALAAGGLRYQHAYASSPWTLPSHATIFSGLEVDQHGVGMSKSGRLPEALVTLAERMQAAGYQTVAISENAMLSDTYRMLQGFELRRVPAMEKGDGLYTTIDTVHEIRELLAHRDTSRPLFLFVNIYDPHSAYSIHENNRWVPSGTDPQKALAMAGQSDAAKKPDRWLCGALPSEETVEILRGLYLNDVSVADRKVGELVELLRRAESGRGLITVVTSDHGEHFGERRLMGHLYSLHTALLEIPLIVHGLEGVEPDVIEEVVGLVDIMPSVLSWAKIEVPEEMVGRPLPESADSPGRVKRVLLSAFSDQFFAMKVPKGFRARKKDARQHCSESDAVYGTMATLIRYPFKFQWFEHYPAELYDLSWDPNELSNQTTLHKDLVERFESEIKSTAERLRMLSKDAAELPPEAVELLRSLGYVE